VVVASLIYDKTFPADSATGNSLSPPYHRRVLPTRFGVDPVASSLGAAAVPTLRNIQLSPRSLALAPRLLLETCFAAAFCSTQFPFIRHRLSVPDVSTPTSTCWPARKISSLPSPLVTG